MEAKGQVVDDATSSGKVIELEDVLLQGGVAIALVDIVVVSIADELEELAKGDGIFLSLSSESWLMLAQGYGGKASCHDRCPRPLPLGRIIDRTRISYP